MEEAKIYAQLKNVLLRTELDFLGQRYEGKVRDSYSSGDVRYLVTTDRLSCFDRVVTTIPFKGEVLQRLAVNWFKLSGDIIQNHIIDVPDPNMMVVKNCEIVPIEVVVRAYLTGSAWRDYEKGSLISGIRLPSGLRQSQRLPQVLLTPSTKAEQGEHDTPISEKEILSSAVVSQSLWQEIKEAAFALFALGEEVANKNGLILVDTKYEFGLYDGKLILADEIHTLDSSRYWVKSSYLENFEKGLPQVMLDKEPVRQWLISKGFMGDGPVPEFSDAKRVEISQHYISSFEKISGSEFCSEPGPVLERLEKNARLISSRS